MYIFVAHFDVDDFGGNSLGDLGSQMMGLELRSKDKILWYE